MFPPIRAFIIPLGAALAIIALAGQAAQSRGVQHADCRLDACTMTVVR